MMSYQVINSTHIIFVIFVIVYSGLSKEHSEREIVFD